MNSYWIDSVDKMKFESVNKDYEADVCVIGAGITGLSVGYYLSKNGLKVAIVDKDEIGQKTSGHTTAKVTLQHNLIYDYLINSFGMEYATQYFEANKNAISNIKEIIDCENISCDFEYKPNYVYTKKQDNILKIQKEVESINNIVRRKYLCTICY